MKWDETEIGRLGSTYECVRERDEWFIGTPGRGEPPVVELRYGRRKVNGMATCLEIGLFASAGEAMLAARMYDENAAFGHVEGALAELGFKDWYTDAVKLDLKDGRRSEGYFVFATAAGGGPENDLTYEGRGRNGTRLVARMWAQRMHDERFQPIGVADLRGVERAIMLELLKVRLARGPGRYAEPLDVKEFRAWEEARYGRTVDPDADRPSSLASEEVRNAAARELLLGDEALQRRLGILPGLEERFAFTRSRRGSPVVHVGEEAPNLRLGD